MGGGTIGRQIATWLWARVGLRTWSARAALLTSLIVVVWTGPASAAGGYSFAPIEGVVFSGTVAMGSVSISQSGCPLVGVTGTADIDWGDGSPNTTGTAKITNCTSSSNPSQMSLIVTASHTWSEEGVSNVTANCNFGSGIVAVAGGTAGVQDAPLSATGATGLTAIEGVTTPAVVRLARFTDADPGGTVSDYRATISWGDGATSVGTVAADPSGGFDVVSPMHTFADEGSAIATVTVVDGGGSTASATDKITIADAPLAVTAGSGVTATENAMSGPLALASFSDGDPFAGVGDFTATINWGDGTLGNGTVTPVNAGVFVVTGAHEYSTVGPHSARVTVTDVGGASSSADVTINVTDVPPSAETLPADAVTQSTAVLHASVDPHGGGATARFQWGTHADLSGAAVTAVQPVAAGVGAVPVSAPVSGLPPGTRYYFRVEATDTATNAPVYGAVQTFTTTTPPSRIGSVMVWGFDRHRHDVVVKSLIVEKLPQGATVQTQTCNGRRCQTFTAAARRTVTRHCHNGHCTSKLKPAQVLDLSSHFRNRRLPTTAQITVRVSKAGWVGKVFIFPMNAPNSPRISCLAPGATVPGQGC
jgi:hypothetical protein